MNQLYKNMFNRLLRSLVIKEQTGQDSLDDITFNDGLTEIIDYIDEVLKRVENDD